VVYVYVVPVRVGQSAFEQVITCCTHDILTVALVLTHCTLLVLLCARTCAQVCVPYFCLAHLVYKHQLLYVYEPAFETGGTFFPKIFRRFIFGVFVAQVID
jgi:Calcium-dependent channel, 7TM region, putative phosphate